MLIMIDNYDSFTYNLVQYFEQLGTKVEIFRNDKITIKEIENLKPKYIVISPGPGRPDSAGISKSVIKHFAGKLPILGVCLGHQAIAEVYGGKIVPAKRLMHGKTSMIFSDEKSIYKNIKSPFSVMRYHSLIVEKDSLPEELVITAQTNSKEIMGIRHKQYAIEGVQFHPESIMTKSGKKLLRNFLKNNNS